MTPGYEINVALYHFVTGIYGNVADLYVWLH